MLIQAVRYTVPEETSDDVAAMLRELRKASLAEAGCARFDICRGDADAAGSFVLFEWWRDQAALDAHSETEHFERLIVNGVRKVATSRFAVKGTPVE